MSARDGNRDRDRDFLIAYGSQTGQSEAIAKIIEKRAMEYGLRPRLCVLNDIEKKFRIEEESLMVIVCSSTGDGDPPENAIRFMRFISQRSLPSHFLSNTTFALLGLGDSNYSTFQGNPRSIEKHFTRLGAKKLIETGAADDQIGLELTVEPWLENLFGALQNWFHLNCTNMESSNDDTVEVNDMQRLSLGGQEMAEERLNGILRALGVHSPQWPEDSPCLVKGAQKLQEDADLRVPIPSTPYLKCQINADEFDTENLPWQNGCAVVGALNHEYRGRVVGVTEITSSMIQKPKQEMLIDLEGCGGELLYEPGDAFYFVVPNPRDEVNFILERIGLLEKSDRKMIVTVQSETTKRNPAVPPYIPEISTPRYIFTWCLDIRRSPGRPLLRILAECTKNAAEKRRILELCSAQGVEEFTKFVRQAGLSLVDFLLNFPSCRPAIERLIELLPRLLPRPYSVSCITELWGKRMRFIFSLMQFAATDGRRYCRHGLCTGWFSTLKKGQQLVMFLKEPSRFRLPPPMHAVCDDITRLPLIMVCTGTGIAPFLSFLQKLQYLEAKRHKVERELYFGCRNLKEDCIYREFIQQCRSDGILSHLSICESQPDAGSSRKKHVQDAILERGREITGILLGKDSDEKHLPIVFVCGSAKQMLKDVADAFMRIFTDFSGKSKEDAESFLRDLRKNDQYVEDVW